MLSRVCFHKHRRSTKFWDFFHPLPSVRKIDLLSVCKFGVFLTTVPFSAGITHMEAPLLLVNIILFTVETGQRDRGIEY